MKILFPFLLIFLPTFISAQLSFPTAATNPKWRVKISGIFGSNSIGDYRLGGDTLIYGKHYEKILLSFSPNVDVKALGFVRNVGKKVYIITYDYLGRLSTEKLMYDFSLELGQTTYCAFNFGDSPIDTTLCWANSIDSTVFMGVKRKRWHMTYSSIVPFNPHHYFTWIEGIGTYEHPFLPIPCLLDGCEIISSLLCFEESNMLKFLNSNYPSCGIPLTKVNDLINEDEVKLYPKLATHQITINNNNLNNLTIKISNSLGQIFIAKALDVGTNSVDVSALASGIYFALISDGYKRRVEKFVKQ
jgi:Secretion system C-terminal sorting domain